MEEDEDTKMALEIFSYAENGRVSKIKPLLYNIDNVEKRKRLLNHVSDGSSPLLIACRNGHTEIVKCLIGTGLVNIEQSGCVEFDGDKIEHAPPLWCAAAAGYIDIVSFLLEKGAEVNSTTHTNSTPLRAACFDGHCEIVQCLLNHGADIEKANKHGHTCLMISCYRGYKTIVEIMLQRGAQVNRKSHKGNTALHDSAEAGNLDIMRLLLKTGAEMLPDASGVTPMMAASLNAHVAMVEFMAEMPEISTSELVKCWKLLGCTFVDKKRDLTKGIWFWTKAIQLEDDQVRQAKLPPPVAAYNDVQEFRTLQDLRVIASIPDDIKMLSLLLRERILGAAHPDTTYYIRYRGALLADLGDFDRCIDLWQYALMLQQTSLDPLHSLTVSSFVSFSELFTFMASDQPTRPHQSFEFSQVYQVLECAFAELIAGRNGINSPSDGECRVECHSSCSLMHLNRLLQVTLHLLYLVIQNAEKPTKEQYDSLCCQLYKLIKLDIRWEHGWTPLHLAASKEAQTISRYSSCSFPSPVVVELLLEVGADANIVDEDGNTALHIAAISSPCRPEILKHLLENGCHVDTRNKRGQTACQLLKDTPMHNMIPLLRFQTLQCLAANLIVDANIKYKGILPKGLQSFIQLHCGCKSDEVLS